MIVRSTTQTSTIRRRPASTGGRALATSDSPNVQRRRKVRRILLSLLVAEARRFLTPRYQSTAALTVQRYPTARTTRYRRPARTATSSRRPAWGARAGTSASPTVRPPTFLSAWEPVQHLLLHLHLQRPRPPQLRQRQPRLLQLQLRQRQLKLPAQRLQRLPPLLLQQRRQLQLRRRRP